MFVPQVMADSHPSGRNAPSGFLFPNMSRLDGDATPQLFDGVQKLVQQIYFELFTDPLPSGIGSGFASRLREANEDTIQAVAQTGVADLLARMLRYQEGYELAPDERIANLVLRSIEFDSVTNRFELVLELTTAAGTQYELRPPLV